MLAKHPQRRAQVRGALRPSVTHKSDPIRKIPKRDRASWKLCRYSVRCGRSMMTRIASRGELPS